jgi:hypothetical protein
MGAANFNACSVIDDAGFYTPAWMFDGGAGPTLVGCYHDCTGRRPAAMVREPSSQTASSVGEFLACAAHLEAASVPAFLELAAQLEDFGAPASLVRRALQAAADEVRHADLIGGLARAHGGVVRKSEIAPTASRDLLEVAMLNAAEGCVRETWGAACAVAQSTKAADGGVRRAMAVIARDELAHAALAWDIADWIEPLLTREQRKQVAAARQQAITELEGQVALGAPGHVSAALGLPSPAESRRILGAIRAQVWTAAA